MALVLCPDPGRDKDGIMHGTESHLPTHPHKGDTLMHFAVATWLSPSITNFFNMSIFSPIIILHTSKDMHALAIS